MKAWTDIEQSRKLAEILPLESADMRFCFSHNLGGRVIGHYPMIGREPSMGTVPCWSLAALLNVIPYTIYKSDNEFYRLGIDKGYDDYAVWYNDNGFTITDLDVASDNFVDACVEMIIKLHEQKLL